MVERPLTCGEVRARGGSDTVPDVGSTGTAELFRPVATAVAPWGPLHVVAETGRAALDLLGPEWDDLVGRQRLPNPTLTGAWLRRLAVWETGLPLVVVATAGGRLVGGAALELRQPVRRGPRVATWLGPVEQIFSADILTDPGRPDAAEQVLQAVFAHAQLVHLAAPASGPAAAALARIAPWRRVTEIGRRWVVDVPPPRLDYARKRAAYELRRGANRGVSVEVRVAADPSEVDAALVRLFRVHRGRWGDRPDETARFATTAAHRSWNREAVAALAAGGGVRIAEVLEDGRAVAGCLGLLHAHGGLGHTWAVQPGGAVRQPGHVAVLACVEALAEAGAEAVDLAVGGGHRGSPKTRLGAEPEPMLALLAAASPSRQRLLGMLRGAARACRRR